MKREVEVKSFSYDVGEYSEKNLRFLKNILVNEIFSFLVEKIRRLEVSIYTFAMARLNERQKLLLKELAQILDRNRELTMTSAGRILSLKLRLPESTVKWNLRELRNMGLIIAGDVNNKGTSVRLTEVGQIIARKLLNNGDGGKDYSCSQAISLVEGDNGHDS